MMRESYKVTTANGFAVFYRDRAAAMRDVEQVMSTGKPVTIQVVTEIFDQYELRNGGRHYVFEAPVGWTLPSDLANAVSFVYNAPTTTIEKLP